MGNGAKYAPWSMVEAIDMPNQIVPINELICDIMRHIRQDQPNRRATVAQLSIFWRDTLP